MEMQSSVLTNIHHRQNLRQNMMNAPEELQKLIAAEPLPPCYICGRTDMVSAKNLEMPSE
jgi:hypothetical protein